MARMPRSLRGTDVVVMANHWTASAGVFIDLTHISGTGNLRVSEDGATCTAGGGATFAALARLSVRCLAQAALSVGGPQIRNRARSRATSRRRRPRTGDGAVGARCAGAAASVRGARTMPLDAFFLDYRKDRARGGRDHRVGGVSHELAHGVAQAGQARRDEHLPRVLRGGHLADGRARVAFGSVAPYPMRAPRTEERLPPARSREPARIAARSGRHRGRSRVSRRARFAPWTIFAAARITAAP